MIRWMLAVNLALSTGLLPMGHPQPRRFVLELGPICSVAPRDPDG